MKKRADHIQAMKKSCDRLGIAFTEITSNFDSFFETVQGNERPVLVIIDDFGKRLMESQSANNMFNVYGSHSEATIIVTWQQYFLNGPHATCIRRALTDFVIWPIDRDEIDRRNVSKNIFGKADKIDGIKAWLDANIEYPPNRYVHVDKNHNAPAYTPEEVAMFSIQTNLFKDERGIRDIVYLSFS